jgi:hypothetical protein
MYSPPSKILVPKKKEMTPAHNRKDYRYCMSRQWCQSVLVVYVRTSYVRTLSPSRAMLSILGRRPKFTSRSYSTAASSLVLLE